MTAQTLLYIIIGVILFDFLLERFLDILNRSRWSDSLPESLQGIYDQEKYSKQQNYERVKFKFRQVASTFSLVTMLLMFLLNGFAFVNTYAVSSVHQPILQALIFFGILMFASSILGIPFKYYRTFYIEERFGFNKTTSKTFVLDILKGWLLGAVLGGGVLALVIWFFIWAGEYFWLYAWGAISFIMIFMALFYSNLIVPLFNKQTPLEEGELRSKIEAFSREADFKLDNIYVINSSKRSTKSDAYFTGFGSRKRIVLYDTLINDLSDEEIVAVLAHEVGHYKKNHTLIGIGLSVIQTGFMLFLLSLFIDSPLLSLALGISKPAFHIGLLVFGILYSPVSTVFGVIINAVTRKNEYQADEFAAVHYDHVHTCDALKKLYVNNLSNLTPHPLYVFFNYSHPTLLNRLEAINDNDV
ncbi:MAG: M48 family metalloprotease [Candidatus Aegiribacteria sp.]|nr:M48 family metalloprotease [Candidatus Aegiribacteria sp.]